MKKLALFLILFSAQAIFVNEVSASVKISQDIYSECVDKSIAEWKKTDPDAGLNNGIASNCMLYASDEYKKQINKLYKQLMATLKAENDTFGMELVETAQKKWLKYRESKCNLFNTGLEELSCLMDENEARVKKLKKMQKDRDPFYSPEEFFYQD